MEVPELGKAYSMHVLRRDMHSGFMKNLKDRHRFEDPCIDGRIILEWIFKKLDKSVLTGLICLRPGIKIRVL